MKHIVFSIHDIKAEAYLPPFVCPTEGIATRTFADCVADPTHQFSKNPDDYTLFKLGTFDDETGLFSQVTPETLGNGLQHSPKMQQLREAHNG